MFQVSIPKKRNLMIIPLMMILIPYNDHILTIINSILTTILDDYPII